MSVSAVFRIQCGMACSDEGKIKRFRVMIWLSRSRTYPRIAAESNPANPYLHWAVVLPKSRNSPPILLSALSRPRSRYIEQPLRCAAAVSPLVLQIDAAENLGACRVPQARIQTRLSIEITAAKTAVITHLHAIPDPCLPARSGNTGAGADCSCHSSGICHHHETRDPLHPL